MGNPHQSGQSGSDDVESDTSGWVPWTQTGPETWTGEEPVFRGVQRCIGGPICVVPVLFDASTYNVYCE